MTIPDTVLNYCANHDAKDRATLFREIHDIIQKSRDIVVCSRCKTQYKLIQSPNEPSVGVYVPNCDCNAEAEKVCGKH